MDQSHLTDAAKVAGVNTTAIIISLSGVETAIRLAGLVAALVYTCLKIADWVRDRKERRALESPATKNPHRLWLIWIALVGTFWAGLLSGCAGAKKFSPLTVAAASAIHRASVGTVRARAATAKATASIQAAREAMATLEQTATPRQRKAATAIKTSMAEARQQVASAEAELIAVTHSLDESDMKLAALQREGEALASSLAVAERRAAAYHRLKFWLAVAGTGMAFYAALCVVPPLVPYRWGIAAGAGATTSVAIWWSL